VDPGWKKFESGMEKSQIRDKHPGSPTWQELAEKFLKMTLKNATKCHLFSPYEYKI
jgi:hypothetical protein